MFTAAHDTCKYVTAQAGGYNGANNIHTQEMEKFYNETVDDFANLAMAATLDAESYPH
jgi:hypothetical protein